MTPTFFGETSLKAAVRHRVAEHQRLDQIAQGTYWNNQRGCFIGCSLHSNKRSDFERLLGLPEWFAHLGESIFEGLRRDLAVDFPLAVYDATPVGVPWDRFTREVRSRFLHWLMMDEQHGVVRLNDDPRVLAVCALLQRSCDGDEPTPEEWAAARAAAEAAAEAAAGAAASDAALAAAWTAASDAACDAASNAALAAAWTAACDAACDAASDAAGAAACDAASNAALAAAWTAAGAAASDAASNAALAATGAAARAAQRDELLSLLRACQPDTAAVSALPDDLTFRAYYDRVCLEAGAASLLET